MSYLYTLIKYFWQELLCNSITDDVSSVMIKSTNATVNKKISNNLKDLEDFNDGYYKVLNDNLLKRNIDTDLICDYLSFIPYGNQCNFRFSKGDQLSLIHMLNNNMDDAKNMVSQTTFISEVLDYFQKLIRTYYLKDFFVKSNNVLLIQGLTMKLKRVTLYNSGNNEIDSYQTLKERYYKMDLKRQDIISEFVDSAEARELIIEEQKFYLKELERLLEIIEEKGNTTILNEKQFACLLKFIFNFRQEIYKKIELLTENKILIKK